MASLKDIRKRIDSVKRTQKTTSAMKMVSAAKLRRAEDHIREATPYAHKLKSIVSSLSTRFEGEEQDTGFGSLFRNSSGKRTGVILVTSDRGLCGGFNSNLSKALLQQLIDEGVECAEFAIFGRKGNDFFKRTPHKILVNHAGTPPDQHLKLVKEVVGNNLMFTPICIIAFNNIKLAEPTKINLAVLFASLSTFFKIEKINNKNKTNISIITITPNSSDITEII